MSRTKVFYFCIIGAFHGISLSAKLSPKPWLTQIVKWDCCWRQLSPLDSPGFPARSMCGHTLKSSLVNELSVDTLDDQPLPSSGMKLSFSQELAGIGLGNIAFFKTVATGAYFKQIAKNLIVGVTCGAGNMSHFIASSDDTASVNTSSGLTCDKFHFGGPLFLRGFQKNRIGTREEGNDHLGSNAYWHLSIHGYTKKIPFLRGDSWISKNVSAHIFSEICQTGDPSNSGSYSKWLIESGLMTIRSSLGIGLIARLGERGRAELNYCIPIRSSSSDMINAGLQLGIGVTFS